jgi:hypothetical protein
MCPSTKPHTGEKVPRTPVFGDASASTATRASLSMPPSVGTRMSKQLRAEGITLTKADTTTALRIEA